MPDPNASSKPSLTSPPEGSPSGGLSSLALIYLRVSTSRQATKGGESEGYSIPAQREACGRKASDLDARVEQEFVDAGASARSADRPGLQSLLSRLRDGSLPAVRYVIVHKLDRLARDRADDVALLLAIRQAGATLVSCSEQIDETPAGMLLHGIMASIAEFYSHNLSTEAKKGIAEKAKRGGTIGYAPTGYVNVTKRLGDGLSTSSARRVAPDAVASGGREVKGVEIDPVRGPLVAWAFTTYAQGEVSISELVDELAARGLTSRDSRSSGGHLTRASLHRMLSNPYYVGKVVHRGVVYDGQHEALVDAVTFARVQNILASRKKAGSRAWKLDHYLKGTVVCARCHSKLGYSRNTGRGGTYDYFFCLGRATKRTNCNLPYLSAHAVERTVAGEWRTLTLDATTTDAARRYVADQLARQHAGRSRELTAATREVQRLTTAKARLLDAYLAQAVELDDFQSRQTSIAQQLVSAQRRLNALGRDDEQLMARADVVLSLFERGSEVYGLADDGTKRLLNQAAFSWIGIGLEDDETTDGFTDIVQAVRGMTDGAKGDGTDRGNGRDRDADQTRGENRAQGAHNGPVDGDAAQVTTALHPGSASALSPKNPRQALGPNGGSNIGTQLEPSPLGSG